MSHHTQKHVHVIEVLEDVSQCTDTHHSASQPVSQTASHPARQQPASHQASQRESQSAREHHPRTQRRSNPSSIELMRQPSTADKEADMDIDTQALFWKASKNHLHVCLEESELCWKSIFILKFVRPGSELSFTSLKTCCRPRPKFRRT